jgi:hypothetical protein
MAIRLSTVHASVAGLVTRLRGPTADVAAFRERGPLRPPTSSLRAIPASGTTAGTVQLVNRTVAGVPAGDRRAQLP